MYIKMNRPANESDYGISVFFYFIYLCSTCVSDCLLQEINNDNNNNLQKKTIKSETHVEPI